MNSRQIKQQFAEEGLQSRINLGQCSASFAEWIAEKAHGLDEADMKLLMRMGGALHAAELEQNWQQSWA